MTTTRGRVDLVALVDRLDAATDGATLTGEEASALARALLRGRHHLGSPDGKSLTACGRSRSDEMRVVYRLDVVDCEACKRTEVWRVSTWALAHVTGRPQDQRKPEPDDNPVDEARRAEQESVATARRAREADDAMRPGGAS